MNPQSVPALLNTPSLEAKYRKLAVLQRQALDLTLAYEQTRVAMLQKHFESLYHYMALQALWQQQPVKAFPHVDSSETLCSDGNSSDTAESRTGQEAGYPTKVSGSPWTQTETQSSAAPIFRVEFQLRRDVEEAVRCTEVERKGKVRRYLEKMRVVRQKKVFSRLFVGRSETAKAKLRVNGRFVKAFEELT